MLTQADPSQVIAERLEDDTTQPDKKKTGLAQRNAKIWAVKASHSHLLDIAREAYKENVHDIIELVQGYQSASAPRPSPPAPALDSRPGLTLLSHADRPPFLAAVHSLPSLSVTFGQNLVMIVSEDDVDEDGLPGVFKNISKKGAKKCVQANDPFASGGSGLTHRRRAIACDSFAG